MEDFQKFSLYQLSHFFSIHVYSHCVKSVQIRRFFWSVFSRIRTEYGEIRRSLRIQPECGKIRTRKTSVFGLDTFHSLTSRFSLVNPASIYLFKVNNKNTRKISIVFSFVLLTLKRCHILVIYENNMLKISH